MRNCRKWISLYAVCIMVIALVTGCNKGNEQDSGKNVSGGDTKKVTITFGSHQSGLPTTGIVQDMAKEFEVETGIKIEFQISPDAQWRDLIKVKLNAGEAPDIICVDTPINLISSLRMDKYAIPLTQEEWVSRIDTNVLPSISVDNDVYGITFPGKKMYFYLYNKTIFEEYNLSIPTTYEEFTNVCQILLDAGKTPIYEATTNGWHQVLPLFETGGLYQQNHADLYNRLNANEIDLDDIPELLTIIEQLKESAEAGYFGTDYLSNAWEGAKEAMASERCVMTIAETGFKSAIEADYPEFDSNNIGIFVMPWGDNQVIGVNPGSNAYFINKESKYTEEAKLFFEFLARPKNLAKRLAGQPEINEVCWPEIPGRYTDEEQAYIDSLEKASVVQIAVNYIDAQWMDVGKDLEALFLGVMTPEDVLQSIMKRRTDMAELYRDEGWMN